jgi:hypothetical protein
MFEQGKIARISLRLACALMGAFAIGCGSDDEDDLSTIACEPGKLTLSGKVGDDAISLSHDRTSSMFQQLQEPYTLEVTFGPAGDGFLHLEWTYFAPNGERIPATGTLRMPAGHPRAGQPLCVGAGTAFLNEEDGVRFVLGGISSGDTCPGIATPGELKGCNAD